MEETEERPATITYDRLKSAMVSPELVRSIRLPVLLWLFFQLQGFAVDEE